MINRFLILYTDYLCLMNNYYQIRDRESSYFFKLMIFVGNQNMQEILLEL